MDQATLTSTGNSRTCKICLCILTSENSAQNRRSCKSCRSKHVMNYQFINADKRKIYVNSYLRRIGKIKEYPCEVCEIPCYKKYKNALCSDKCRFMFYVEKTDNCWIWKGGRNRRGYGKFMAQNKLIVASRFSYELFNGPISEGMLICHACDNPPCVNPAHLWQGTNSENQLDSVKKGRRK